MATPERFRVRRTAAGGVSIGYSALKTYRQCPQLFWNSYLQGGDGIQVAESFEGMPNVKMVYGALWHAAYHARLMGLDEHAALMRVAQERNLGAASDILAEIQPDLDWYWSQPKDMKVKVLAAEKEFAVSVGPHILRGTPDLVAEVEGSWGGGIYIVDHKTWVAMSADGKVYMKASDAGVARHLHSHQFAFYMGLWNLAHPDMLCRGAIVNMVPQRITAVIAKLQGRTRGNKEAPGLTRDFVLPSNRLVERVLDNARLACDEIAARDVSEAYAMNNAACVSQWGTLCPFITLCEGSDTARESALRNLYEPRTFTPVLEEN